MVTWGRRPAEPERGSCRGLARGWDMGPLLSPKADTEGGFGRDSGGVSREETLGTTPSVWLG